VKLKATNKSSHQNVLSCPLVRRAPSRCINTIGPAAYSSRRRRTIK